ncbi:MULTISPECIES: bifunctional aminoglycoside phosphotransferase/ATP-binding protein [Dietzia]|uniref:bifunctional aminoglycoside phosphotransferase/ATP-binding protein n=1 Tax=Dietzia TaxID=37914 RepID=UPI0007814413|nr:MULTISPECIES: AAA family ATPase [Dietzia]MBM7231440.1 AAA family ATPase [Dietzia cinnamea]MCT2119935.1 AAA family ATPase [Dietzia cinnamea]MCT2139266.1 AAA family ATPase [Dietzia cinnamea]MCT2143977.1 AAA family ATPase [Dietzia cinnamea]MCT2264626.1 AAA family ATPase [Dietzia cinnamea]
MDASADAGPPPLGPPVVVETHSALIFLWGDEAHKVRKPVDLGFLDNTTVGARGEQSRREVELNSRLAPDVYRGVLEVRGPDGEVVDHVVWMRRLPARRSLASLVRLRAESGLGGGDTDIGVGLTEAARQIARLHAAGPRSEEIDAAGTPAAVAGLWARSLEHLRRLDVGRDAPEIVDDIESLATDYLRGRGPLLESRVAAGRIVDGHGDLLAADVYLLDDGPRVIDCLEFDDLLRYGDAVLDIGFLAMDLDASGARDLAVVLLGAYREASGDDAPPSLIHHYIGYRAIVRSKVTAIRAEQAADGDGGRGDARRALGLADLAVDSLLRARVRLVLVGGVSGSGKSTLAAPLAEALGAELLRSDVVRADVVRADVVREQADPGSDRYSEEAVGAVYAEMLARAAASLALGRSVVLDATWLEPRRRAEAETVAADAHAELVEISCTAPRDELVRRITDRARAGSDPSEATIEVLDDQLARPAAWPEAIEVDTVGLDVRDGEAVRRWAERELGPLPWA